MIDLEQRDPFVGSTAAALAAYEPPQDVEPAVEPYVGPTCFADLEVLMRDYETLEDFASAQGLEPFWRVLDPAPGNFRWQGKRVIGIIGEPRDYGHELVVQGVWTEPDEDGLDIKHMGVQLNDLDWDHSVPYQPRGGGLDKYVTLSNPTGRNVHRDMYTDPRSYHDEVNGLRYDLQKQAWVPDEVNGSDPTAWIETPIIDREIVLRQARSRVNRLRTDREEELRAGMAEATVGRMQR